MIFTESHIVTLNARLKEAIGNDVMTTARLLRVVRDYEPELLPTILETHAIGKRSAYSLMQIDRVFGTSGIPPERLNRLGVAKLILLARQVIRPTAASRWSRRCSATPRCGACARMAATRASTSGSIRRKSANGS